jgi:hypothetical protein
MRRIRRHLTFANVCSLVALFAALGLGGTALAAVVINNNNQVAPNTISGHHPPAGKHANIISGSVNGQDLSAKLKESVGPHCPAGLQRAADLCFETSLRPQATLDVALKTCASAQRRLPTDAELALIFDHSGAPQPFQWVATHATDINGSNTYTKASALREDESRNIIFSAFDVSVTFNYVCVTSAIG